MAVVAVLLVLARPTTLLLVLVAALPWEDELAYPTETLTLVKLLGVMLLVSWLLRALSGEEELRPLGPLSWALVLAGAVLLSLVVSPDPGAGLVDAARYASFIVFAFLVVQLAQTREDVVRIVRVLVLSASAAAAYALYGVVIGGERLARGPIGDPNDFAYFIVVVLPLAGYLMGTDRARRRLWAVCFVVLAAAMLATLSRGALVGLAALAVWGVATGRVRLRGVLLTLAVLAGVVGVALAVWAPQLQDRLAGKEQVADENIASRQALWEGALRMAADRPLVGVGPGRFGAEAPDYVHDSPLDIADPVAHNAYLQVLAEVGILGLAGFVGFLAATWSLLGRTRRRMAWDGDPDGLHLVTALQAAMVTALVSALFLSVHLTAPFWLLGALATALAASALARTEPIPAAPRAHAAA